MSLKASQNTRRDYDKTYDTISSRSLHKLLVNLEKEQPVALHRVVAPFCENQIPRQVVTTLPQRMTSLYNKTLISMTIEEIEAHCEDLIKRYDINAEQRDLVQELTKGQSTCIEWKHYREGRVSGSNCYDVSKTSLNNPARTLIKQIVYPMDVKFRSDATE